MKPRKTIIPRSAMADTIAGRGAGAFLCQRKYDGGGLLPVVIGGATVLCERMARPISGNLYTAADRAAFARHPGGWFAAVTVSSIEGQGVLNRTNGERWQMLQDVFNHQDTKGAGGNIIMAEMVTDVDGAMLAGAEGVCAHDLIAPWGAMLCYKARDIFECVVTATGRTQSVQVACARTGQARGSVTLRGGKCDRVRVGSVIRVEGMAITDDGKIRQPVACSEWLVRY